MRGVQNLEGVAVRVTGTVPLPLGDPSPQRSMNRVVAQQELERQNFRVWLRPPFPVTVRLTQGIMTPHPPAGSGSLFLRPDFRPFFGSLRKDFIVLRDPEHQVLG